MNKRIFTPFPPGVGTLSGRLPYVGNKPDVDGKPTGRYKGFKPDEYLNSPDKIEGRGYVKTTKLEILLSPEDQLYINAHCRAGIDYLASEEKCDTSQKVSVDDLIAQLKAHSLPETSQVRIKLWVCEGALNDGENPSFAQRFSIAMDAAGYKNCRIFSYVLSVLAKYEDLDGEMRKRTVQSPRARLEALIRLVEEHLVEVTGRPKSEVTNPDNFAATLKLIRASTDQRAPVLQGRAMTWLGALGMTRGNRNLALDNILAKPVQMEVLLGTGHGGRGGRAKNSRLEFKNGAIVPN